MKCRLCDLTTGVEEHHVIPRSYGGLEGPTEMLCGSHHTLVHNLAHELFRHGSEPKLAIPDDVLDRVRLLQLVRAIVTARRAWEVAKRKGEVTTKISVKFDPKRSTKIRDLARLLKCSQQEAANVAIDRLHQSLTARSINV